MMEEYTNYQRVDRTIHSGKAQILSVAYTIPIVVLTYFPFKMIWHTKGQFSQSAFKDIGLSSGIMILIIVLLGIILHELVHGISWAIFAKNRFKSIRFGIIWKYLMPYCHVNEPLKVNHYLVGVLSPALFVGILPVIIAFFTGNINILIFGIFFTIAAIGDFLIAAKLLKEDKMNLILDHPNQAGYVLLIHHEDDTREI